MFCYKDMTFCEFYKECKNGDDCFRALKNDVIKEAEIWWSEFRKEGIKDNAPISIFTYKPECFDEKDNGEKL